MFLYVVHTAGGNTFHVFTEWRSVGAGIGSVAQSHRHFLSKYSIASALVTYTVAQNLSRHHCVYIYLTPSLPLSRTCITPWNIETCSMCLKSCTASQLFHLKLLSKVLIINSTSALLTGSWQIYIHRLQTTKANFAISLSSLTSCYCFSNYCTTR